MSLHFSCTMCGRCCHDLRLPLSVDEAITWLARGGEVQLFSDAIPWPEEPPPDDALAQHKRRRSFAAHCGTLPVRVSVTLVASFAGPCPHLRADMACGAYELRPRVCRIYPAEVNPALVLDPASKACPPEAWSPDRPPLIAGGQLVDAQTAELIAQSREADARDRLAKAFLYAQLGYDTTALANEGFAIHSPGRDQLAAALEAARLAAAYSDHHEPASPYPWHLITNRHATLATLQSIDASARLADAAPGADAPAYLGFFEADVPG
ncbi:YkgJ family cysteine cluster protein [Burkholderia plantarii]|uniref:YkgJ family cysteine cluster protein n=1 Tax=Burkholderia plantarii TaxID=41899 RepID=UPI0006D8A707|nr:YkgJ family cysteine cluster protein [Burkholderia plantarii]ALK34293.1 Fe-S oxidoreductase [Burkholderia plantarii]